MKRLISIILVLLVYIVPIKGEDYQDIILKKTNKARIEKYLKPLKMDSKLNKIAMEKAKDMAKNQELSHNSPKFGTTFNLMKKKGIKYSAAGENIARWHSTPEFVVERWLKSKGHRKNILNPEYTQIGIGRAKDKNGKNYWVQVFIKEKVKKN